MKITFFGAAEQVTGSRYLVEHENTKILVDCGMFQGSRETSIHNWDPFPIDPSTIDALVLTHAHIDHTGYIPVLVKKGFRGKIYCSEATAELCALLLVDSGHLQEEQAKESHLYKNSNNVSSFPLYTIADAELSLQYFQPVEFDKTFSIGALEVTLIRSGHILGSSFVIISDGRQALTFSGDLGRPNQLIMKAPTPLKKTDFLVVESTYGSRIHAQEDPVQALGEIVNSTMARGGILVIPAFAVGRAQSVLYCLYQLKQKNAIPNVPIFLDSPMAISVTDLFCDFQDEHKLSSQLCSEAFNIATFARTVEQSRRLNHIKGPAIIVAASGMATGGRVVQHIQHVISDPKNAILFVGFQAEGINGRALIEGAKEIKIKGKAYTVRAEIKMLDSLSAHADANELLEWLGYFESKPKKTFITHGDLESAQALQKKIEERFGWSVVIPKQSESFDLK